MGCCETSQGHNKLEIELLEPMPIKIISQHKSSFKIQYEDEDTADRKVV